MQKKKRPGAKAGNRGRTGINSAGQNAKPSRPKSDNAGQGRRGRARNQRPG